MSDKDKALPWSGRLTIYPEICCELCNEIEHNHLDCPVCGERYAASEQYGELEAENGATVIQCAECHAKFSTKAHWSEPDAIWEEQV